MGDILAKIGQMKGILFKFSKTLYSKAFWVITLIAFFVVLGVLYLPRLMFDSGVAEGTQPLEPSLQFACEASLVEGWWPGFYDLRMDPRQRVWVKPLNNAQGLGELVGDYLEECLKGAVIREEYLQLLDYSSLGEITDIGNATWAGGFNTETSVKLGKLVAPTVIISGSFVISLPLLHFSLSIVDLETGIILGTTNDSRELSPFLATLVEEERQKMQSARARDLENIRSLRGESWLDRILRFLRTHYQWLWAALVAPILGVLWKLYGEDKLARRRPRKKID